jgi:hypothetical protein
MVTCLLLTHVDFELILLLMAFDFSVAAFLETRPGYKGRMTRTCNKRVTISKLNIFLNMN